jgi:hypothetical protein
MTRLQVYILKSASLFGECVCNYCEQLGEYVVFRLLDTSTVYVRMRLNQVTRHVVSAHNTNIHIWNNGVF